MQCGNITDPQVYYDALAKAGSGFYPVSSNGLWHGGVHFDQNTGAQLDQSSVRCIADGEVIAYRIDGKYKTLTYGEGASAHETIYSTGFVLVRHRLELPPVPAPATPAAGGTQPAATPPAAEPDLTFYSLYMHLMDWQGYQDKPELEQATPAPSSRALPTSSRACGSAQRRTEPYWACCLAAPWSRRKPPGRASTRTG